MISTFNNMDPFDPHDEQWYSSLYEEVFSSLIYSSYRIIHNETEAEAIATQCFWKLKDLITNKPEKFDSREHAKSYLKRMVANASINFKKRSPAANKVTITLDFEQIENMDTQALTAELEEHDTLQKILSHIEALPPKLKEIIELYFYKNMSPEQIANQLGQSIEYVYTKKSRALATLTDKVKNSSGPIDHNTLMLLICIYLTTP